MASLSDWISGESKNLRKRVKTHFILLHSNFDLCTDGSDFIGAATCGERHSELMIHTGCSTSEETATSGFGGEP